MILLGIDPGASGGIAALSDEDAAYVRVFKLDGTEQETADFLQEIAGAPHFRTEAVFAVIEKVHAFPGQGVTSMFNFGKNYGFLRGLLVAFKIPFEECPPLKWMRAIGCSTKGDKRVTRQKAQNLFPGVKVTHALADALLIAHYARMLKGYRT